MFITSKTPNTYFVQAWCGGTVKLKQNQGPSTHCNGKADSEARNTVKCAVSILFFFLTAVFSFFWLFRFLIFLTSTTDISFFLAFLSNSVFFWIMVQTLWGQFSRSWPLNFQNRMDQTRKPQSTSHLVRASTVYGAPVTFYMYVCVYTGPWWRWYVCVCVYWAMMKMICVCVCVTETGPELTSVPVFLYFIWDVTTAWPDKWCPVHARDPNLWTPGCQSRVCELNHYATRPAPKWISHYRS